MKKIVHIFVVVMLGVFGQVMAVSKEKPKMMFEKPKYIGSVPVKDITEIEKTKERVRYVAAYESTTEKGKSEGSIECWKDANGTIGCTEYGVVFTPSGAEKYSKPIADENFAKIEKLFKEKKEK